ncbi:MAG: 16S rRNA (guanine(527)-N(7))-methyltransferase RsmG [Prevotella sp.]|nr:16S rRNA (guanine(527)-N(7))-methyltransferase RsmG [Prevotella sp.]MCM1475846.1 16S rRNA (guanine(527)-N(7))-methyltransferase RsmG [Muribaculaceae bacterium]
MQHILKYFTNLSELQVSQFESMMTLYPDWNTKINVISRKDIQNLEINHILHSLSIAKFIEFVPGSSILDLGTGGGFPAIPLAVLFPEVSFHLVDRIAKKLRVAIDVALKIGLKNVSFQHGDIGECHEKFDFVVSRAVMGQSDIISLTRKNISHENRNAIPNGVITLKGGNVQAELGKYKSVSEIFDISCWFDEPFFATKKIVYTPM